MVPLYLLLITCLILDPGLVTPARILGMFPLFVKSHHRLIQPAMKALADAGHEVVVYSPYPLDTPYPNYTDVYMESVVKGGEKMNSLFQQASDTPNWMCMSVWLKGGEIFYEQFIEDEKVQELFNSKEKFDVIFTETFAIQEFILILGHVFQTPIIALHPTSTHGIINSEFGNSLSLSYIPDFCLSFTDRMSFKERLLNVISTFTQLYYFYYNNYIPKMEKLLTQKFPEMPPVLDLTRNVSLVFVNDHLTATYPHPRPPNIIPIAGIHIGSAKPLPENIQQFMDGAVEGVILFSLGTNIADELNPKQYFDMFINVFKQLRQRVLWKTRKEEIEDIPENVMALKWVPQNDILAHPKCVLFITHGGLFSRHETVHFGVPVVAIPYLFDQEKNVRFFEKEEVGVKIQPEELSEATISAAIHTVLEDPRYKANMKKQSKIFRDRPLSPTDTVVYWTEYVIRHGGAGHLRLASSGLEWYQLQLLDVLAAIIVVLVTIAVLLYLVTKRTLRILQGKLQELNKKKKQK